MKTFDVVRCGRRPAPTETCPFFSRNLEATIHKTLSLVELFIPRAYAFIDTMILTMTSENEVKVPVIDLSAVESESSLVDQIANACSEYGFFQVTSHGIPSELVEKYTEQCKLYFALPHETKLQWKRNEGNSRGFFDDELTKQRRDWKQALDFGAPGSRDWSVPDDSPSNTCLDGWNQLPSEEVLPEFRSTVTKYFDACAELSDRIAILMAKGLGQAEDCDILKELRENHSSYLRVNYYPTCNETDEVGRTPLGVSPHRDAGFLTVLLQDDDCHSLQVFKDGDWIAVEPVKGALTINTGDMAQIFSNEKYKAPLHRVLSNETKERYSAPFFYNPSYETLVKPLVLEGQDAVYNPVSWGYFRAVRFAGDLTDLGVEIQTDHFLRDQPSKHLQKQEIFLKEADFRIPFSVLKYRPLLESQEDTVAVAG
jgi:isopenicillin N synthase-like dioxygenase